MALTWRSNMESFPCFGGTIVLVRATDNGLYAVFDSRRGGVRMFQWESIKQTVDRCDRPR